MNASRRKELIRERRAQDSNLQSRSNHDFSGTKFMICEIRDIVSQTPKLRGRKFKRDAKVRGRSRHG